MNAALSQLQQREQALQLEATSLRERAHRYLLDRRQDRRNLRDLAQPPTVGPPANRSRVIP